MEKAVNREDYLEQTQYRFERKFFTSDLCEKELEMALKLNSFIFKEIYYQRFINNIYFDTHFLNSYYDNVDGRDNRIKARIRWYGDLFQQIEKPILEFKNKRGLVGFKDSYIINNFVFIPDISTQEVSNILNKSSLPQNIKLKMDLMNPVLVNRYKRKYFQSSCKRFRVTIDSALSFYEIDKTNNNLINKKVEDKAVILEVKYDKKFDEVAGQVTAQLPIILTKSSKFVQGVDLISFI